jgi:putative sterol carrier protein
MGLVSEELFGRIEARLANIDPNNRTVVHVFKINLKQDGAIVKTMMLDLVNVKWYEGNDSAETTITLDDQLFADIINKKVEAMTALNQDLIAVEGNLELLLPLGEALKTM